MENTSFPKSTNCTSEQNKTFEEIASKQTGGCPVDHKRLNPLNNIPQLSQEKSPGQNTDLSTERTSSTIPKSTSDNSSVWEYPSPQQFHNALLRKGYETPEKEVPTIVDIHNFINEECWNQVMYWESKYHGDCNNTSLLKFQGRPQDITPKAWFYTTFMGVEKPFDRHDWTINRCGTPVRYVIDYYSGGVENGMPVFNCDVRPALDSPSSIFDRFKEGSSRIWDKFFH